MQYKQLNIDKENQRSHYLKILKPIILKRSRSGLTGFILDNLYPAYEFSFQLDFDMIVSCTFSPECPLTSPISLREESICWCFVQVVGCNNTF